MKDLAIIQLVKLPDVLGNDGQIQKNRYKCLRQMGLAPKVVTGVHKLAQYVTKLLFTTQGSDLFDPTYGSSLLFLLRQAQSVADPSDLQTAVATHIQDVQTQVLTSQVNLPLPSDERLKSLSLLSVQYDPVEIILDIEVSLESEAGNARILNLSEVLAE